MSLYLPSRIVGPGDDVREVVGPFSDDALWYLSAAVDTQRQAEHHSFADEVSYDHAMALLRHLFRMARLDPPMPAE